MSYKVSVVVPIYNASRYLRECLDSLRVQTLDGIQVILVNDGSTDDSLTVAQEYLKANKDWKIIDQENHGYGHAVNTGIASAEGAFISIVEPDDYIDANMLERLYTVAERDHLDIVSANYKKFYDYGNERKVNCQRVFGDDALYNKILNVRSNKGLIKGLFINPAGLFSKAFLDNSGIIHNETPGAAFQDRGFFFLTTVMAQRVMVIDDAFYNYRQDNPNSSIASRDDIDKVLTEYGSTLDKLIKAGEWTKDFFGEFFKREFGSCIFSLSRADDSVKLATIKKISNEFCKYHEMGILDASELPYNQKDQMELIMDNPDGVYESILSLRVELAEKLKGVDTFVIYGTGVIGKRVFENLDLEVLKKLAGFTVSNVSGQVMEYKGYPVKCIDEYIGNNAHLAVVVAVTYRYRNEICELLEEKGFSNIIIPKSMAADI